MQGTIDKVARQLLDSETGKEVIQDFLRMKNDKGWRFFLVFVSELGNHIANDVLSQKFQKQPDNEKLIQLAAYSRINYLLKFFVNPTVTFDKLYQRKQTNTNLMQAVAPKPKGKMADELGRKGTK